MNLTGPRDETPPTGMGAMARLGPRPTGPEMVVLCLVLVAGLVHVAYPFRGDQAMFTTAAEGMRHGDRLYVDFWDYKQPGVYLWYLVAGLFFGYRETGIHLAETLYLLAFARYLQVTLRPRFEQAWIAAALPLFTVGAFYAAATSWELTQVEVLVAFPLAVCAHEALLGVDDPDRRTRHLVASGLAAAAVVYFKHLYLGVVVAFWVIAAVSLLRREGSRALRRAAPPALAGLVVPWLPMLAYFAWQGIVGDMWWAFVEYPVDIRGLDPRPTSRLTEALGHTLRLYGWLVPLACAGVASTLRRSRHTMMLVAWFGVGLALVLAQNWWNYHFVLPVWPAGILAALGLDALWSARRRVVPVMVALAGLTVVAAFLPAREAVHKLRMLAGDDFALSADGRRAFTDEWYDYYPYAREITAFLRRPDATPGPIHVIGDPVLLYLSGRTEAMPLNGWAPEQSNARLWERTRDELTEYRPVYLYVDDYSMGFVRDRSPETLALIGDEFCETARTDDGRWYALRGTPPCEGEGS